MTGFLGKSRRGLLAGAASIIALTAAAAAQAQAGGQAGGQVPRQAAGEATRAFAIAPQPLASALAAFGIAADMEVTYPAGLIGGVRSPGVTGAQAPLAALSQLLSGTGFTYRMTGPTSVTLTPVPKAEGAELLDPVNVEGVRPSPTTLPPAYAGGQVARGGRVGLLGAQDAMDTPFSTVAYTSKLMEDQQARTAADTLINDPSVRLTTGSNGFDDTFQIRGFAVPAGDVAFNGMYGLVSSNRVPSQIVERVELRKGPGALVDGIAPGGSIGGAVNVVAKRAGDDPLTRVTTSYISAGSLGAHVDVARRFGENKAWGVRFNGLMRGGEATIDDGDVQTRLGALAVDYRGERLRWSLDAIHQRDETKNFRPQISILSTTTAIPASPDARSNWYPGTTLSQKDQTIASNLEVDLTDALTAYAGVGYRKGENNQIFPVSGPAVDALGNFSVRNSYYDSYSETTSGVVGARWRFETGPVRHTLNIGYTDFRQEAGNAYIQSAGTTASNIYNPSPLPVITAPRTAPRLASKTALTGIAVADTLSMLDDRILLTLGVRDQTVEVKSYSTATGAMTSKYKASATTPMAGLVVKPMANVSLYANYAEGLTRGTIVGAGYANTGAVLEPYKSKQYEAGVKVDWGSVTTTAAVFQVTRPNSIRNAANELAYDGEQRNRGVELSVYGEFMPGLHGMAGASFLEPKLTRTAVAAEQGKDAAGVPDMTLSAGLDWDTPWVEGLSLNGRVIYTSGSYLTNANTLRFDGWTRVDIGARYDTAVAGTPVTLRANVENLFDKNYWLTTGTYVTVGAPRTFLLSTSASF